MREYGDEVFEDSLETAEAEAEEADDAKEAMEQGFMKGAEEEMEDPYEEKMLKEELEY